MQYIKILTIKRNINQLILDLIKQAELMAAYHEVFPDVLPQFKPRINLIVKLSEGTLLSRGNTFNSAQVSTFPCSGSVF